MSGLDMHLVRDAGEFLARRIRRTPTEASPELSRRLDVPVTLKLECLQVTGSFKIRGAFFRLSRLTCDERRRGIVTCSAGNHGKAVAYAARELGLEATVYVPRDVDEAKHRGMLALGAKVIRADTPGYDDTLARAQAESAATGKTFVSAFDDDAIMAANGGTLALEVLEQAGEARTFILPVGGGGLAAGFAFVAKERLSDCRIIACQHEKSAALAMSLERGEAVTRLPAVETVAGGVEGGIGARCFSVLGPRVDRVALVAETEIIDGFRWMLEHHQYLIEPTAAVPVAACLAGKAGPLDSPAVIVLTGRNVGMPTIRRLLGDRTSS
jgi:threonine dehydratase